MISREWAVDLVERWLAADWSAQTPAYRAHVGEQMVIVEVQEHELGWLITCQSRRWAQTRDVRDMLIGHGPFLVDGEDGSIHMVHSYICADGLEWPDYYRERIRGEAPPREIDTEVLRQLGLGRRFDALKAVRRAGGDFSPAEAQRIVDALGAGLGMPEDFAARLPQPAEVFPGVATLSGPNPEPQQPESQVEISG